MKRLKLLISLLILPGALLAVSCGDDDKPEVRDSLKVSPTSHTFEAVDQRIQEFKVEKSAPRYKAVLVNSTDTWVRIDEQADAFYVTVDNFTDPTATENRRAEITVTSSDAEPVTVTIYQKYSQNEQPELLDMTLGESSVTFEPSKELSKSVRIITEIDFDDITVHISGGDQSWIDDAYIHNGELVVKVKGNPGEQRDGTVTVKSDKAKADAILKVTQKKVVMPVKDLSGDWRLTASIYMQTDNGFDPSTANYSKVIDMYFHPDSGGYAFDDQLTAMGISVDFTCVITVAEDGKVYYEHGIPTGEYYNFGSIDYLEFYNFVTIRNPSLTRNLIKSGYELELTVDSGYDTITAPEQIWMDGMDSDVYVGTGGLPGGYTVDNFIPNPAFCYKNLKLERL